ncbi:MAG: pentapeptide repeat-containing protein [Rhodobacter sp.]|nr:pentapeptide repeat-containing protein [Paracoccaceae bacterium]MCC0080451.1 pentapeptide repeat-containing protein [Rhodobacter sp.]
MEQDQTGELLVDLSASRFSVAFSILFFAFGIAAGFLLAFSGLGFLQDSAGVIAGVFLVALCLLALAGLVLYLLRDRILTRLFGLAGAQVDVIATPLAEVAQGAARRDPEQAAQSARRLIQVALARYAWLATRRWIMTSLTALIAAMAALAGTALLFKQNDLIAQQIVLLGVQNDRIQQQNALLEQQTELAEAARNAALAVEVTAVAGLLGEAVDRVMGPVGQRGPIEIAPVLHPETDVPRSVLFRLIALSQALRPYRFLDPGFNHADESAMVHQAMLARREAMPQTYARMADLNGWVDRAGPAPLVDRPGSPERGQLLRVMMTNGLRETEILSFYGLDLSFATAQGLVLAGATMQNANLSYADLSYGQVIETDLRGATLANARMRHAQIMRSDLGFLPAESARGPYATQDIRGYAAPLVGLDLSDALIEDSDFSGSNAMAAIFDRALMIGVDLRDTTLAGASFRGAVLIAPQWQGAQLSSVDLDGAVLTGADPLADLAAAAAPDSFVRDRYRAARVDLLAVLAAHDWADDARTDRALALTGDQPAWRIERIGAFP